MPEPINKLLGDLCFDAHEFLVSHCYDPTKIVELLSYAVMGMKIVNGTKEIVEDGKLPKDALEPARSMLMDYRFTKELVRILTDVQQAKFQRGDPQ